MADNITERTYRNDPIIEVVCEFRFVPSTHWDPTIPGLIYEKVKDIFPKRDVVRRIRSSTAGTEKGLEQAVQWEERAQLLQEDELAFIQIGANLLAINHLKPYPTWKKFLPLIEKSLAAYREIAQPRSLRRIGLRYINKIEFDTEKVLLDEYFLFAPVHPFKTATALRSFFVGIEAIHENGRDTLKMQLSSTLATPPNLTAVILDLDYALGQPEAVLLDEVISWADEIAHVHIQEAFEASLTEDLKSTFDPVLG